MGTFELTCKEDGLNCTNKYMCLGEIDLDEAIDCRLWTLTTSWSQSFSPQVFISGIVGITTHKTLCGLYYWIHYEQYVQPKVYAHGSSFMFNRGSVPPIFVHTLLDSISATGTILQLCHCHWNNINAARLLRYRWTNNSEYNYTKIHTKHNKTCMMLTYLVLYSIVSSISTWEFHVCSSDSHKSDMHFCLCDFTEMSGDKCD